MIDKKCHLKLAIGNTRKLVKVQLILKPVLNIAPYYTFM